MLEWSYELLTEAEQAMWRRVSVANVVRDSLRSMRIPPDPIGVAECLEYWPGSRAHSRRHRRRPLFGAAEALAAIPAVMQPALSAHYDAALAARQEAFAPGRVAWIAALDADHEHGQRALSSGRRSPGAAR